ncbi:MAG: hypothetical protein JKY41_16170 [Rhodobacteraceae bacterium]|nr:hypothetical protein [Paracoccaceae bacterium]
MKLEQSLKLVPVKKPKQVNPIVHRRERLLKSINNQIEMVRRYRLGEKTNRLWFWSDENGNTFLPIKYGKVVLELGKGKYSIQCSSVDDVETNLETVKTLVIRGEFDDILTKVSKEIRAKFGRD